MKKFVLPIALLFVSSFVFSQDYSKEIAKGKQLTVSNGCTACHQEFGPKLAPGYAGIGVKFKKDGIDKAVDNLASAIAKGSKGQYPKFKDSVMPPYAHLSEADRKAIARYILSLSK